MKKTLWHVQLAIEAEKDLLRIVEYTQDNFGYKQAVTYRNIIVTALALLENGPNILGSLTKDEISHGMRCLHVARGKRHGRHIILYRAASNNCIEVIRILHDAMDIAQHIL